MGNFVDRITLVGLLLLSGCASARSEAPNETITVSRRPSFAICAGVCPNYDVTVWADGRVLAVRHHLDAPDAVERFRVSRAEAVRFESMLLPYRPAGDQPVPTVCKHNVRADEAPFVIKVIEIEIRWSGADHGARLAACDNSDNAGLDEAIRQALWSVHLYVDGNRRD